MEELPAVIGQETIRATTGNSNSGQAQQNMLPSSFRLPAAFVLLKAQMNQTSSRLLFLAVVLPLLPQNAPSLCSIIFLSGDRLDKLTSLNRCY